METPKTLLEAITTFANPEIAHDFVKGLRWPNGVACPRHGCGSADVREIRGKRPRWYCRECKREFTAKVGTIFEDSPIGFDKWLPAMWLLSANCNGISSMELHRALGVTQKTAWFMLHRIRLAMQEGHMERLSGEVEVDETYFGGAPRNRRPRIAVTRHGQEPTEPIKTYEKTAVMGFRERGGRVRAFVIPNEKMLTLHLRLRDHVEPGSTLYTDAHPGYTAAGYSYAHYVINHSLEYVRDHHVHTNNIENFWSVLKRTIGGTYICPRPKHLDRYLDEQIFRFNERESTDGPRFVKAVKGADSKRLTYKALIRKKR